MVSRVWKMRATSMRELGSGRERTGSDAENNGNKQS